MRRSEIAKHEVLEGLAAPDQSGLAVLDEDYGGSGGGVVVGGHGQAVRSRGRYGYQITAPHHRKLHVFN